MARIPMDWKELREGRRVGIPESIIGKMAIGIEPSEREKEIINKLGKVYVEAHKRDGKWVKPQLRDLPGGSKSRGLIEEKLDWMRDIEDEYDNPINFLTPFEQRKLYNDIKSEFGENFENVVDVLSETAMGKGNIEINWEYDDDFIPDLIRLRAGEEMGDGSDLAEYGKIFVHYDGLGGSYNIGWRSDLSDMIDEFEERD